MAKPDLNEKETLYNPRILDREQLEYSAKQIFTYGVILVFVVGSLASVGYVMVKQLRKGTDIQTAREMNARLQTIEGDADKLELELLRDLYHADYSAKHIIFLRDLYELLEKVIDRCRDAGNVILQVVLKYA